MKKVLRLKGTYKSVVILMEVKLLILEQDLLESLSGNWAVCIIFYQQSMAKVDSIPAATLTWGTDSAAKNSGQEVKKVCQKIRRISKNL